MTTTVHRWLTAVVAFIAILTALSAFFRNTPTKVEIDTQHLRMQAQFDALHTRVSLLERVSIEHAAALKAITELERRLAKVTENEGKLAMIEANLQHMANTQQRQERMIEATMQEMRTSLNRLYEQQRPRTPQQYWDLERFTRPQTWWIATSPRDTR